MAFRLAAEGLQDLLVGFFERARRQILAPAPAVRLSRRVSAAPRRTRRSGLERQETRNAYTSSRVAQKPENPHSLIAAKRWISILDHRSQGRQQMLARIRPACALMNGDERAQESPGEGAGRARVAGSPPRRILRPIPERQCAFRQDASRKSGSAAKSGKRPRIALTRTRSPIPPVPPDRRRPAWGASRPGADFRSRLRNSAARIRPRFSTAVITTFMSASASAACVDPSDVTGLNSAQNIKDKLPHILVAILA